MQDQIEMLTHETRSTSPTRVKNPAGADLQTEEQRNSLLDSVAHEVEDPTPPGEKPFIQGFETTLTWVAYVAIIGVALLLTWSVGSSIMKYMVWR